MLKWLYRNRLSIILKKYVEGNGYQYTMWEKIQKCIPEIHSNWKYVRPQLRQAKKLRKKLEKEWKLFDKRIKELGLN